MLCFSDSINPVGNIFVLTNSMVLITPPLRAGITIFGGSYIKFFCTKMAAPILALIF